MLLLQLLIPSFALPTKQLQVSLILDKEFNLLNSETALLKNDSLIISPSHYNSEYEEFMAQFTSKGSFDLDILDKQLIISQDGSLKLASRHLHQDNESNIEHDDDVQRHIFSIKEGNLSFNGETDFTLCQLQNDKESFSIHLTYSESASNDCNGAINGFKIKVFNQLGIQHEDFESPEFIYNTGKIVYF